MLIFTAIPPNILSGVLLVKYDTVVLKIAFLKENSLTPSVLLPQESVVINGIQPLLFETVTVS